MTSTTRSAALGAGTLVTLGMLYFAQGLPYGFFTQALPVVLRQSGYTLTEISATGLLFAPWAVKFLWAPYVDRYGTRRRWLRSSGSCRPRRGSSGSPTSSPGRRPAPRRSSSGA